MGTLKSCFATGGESVEIAVLGLYDETKAREVASVEYPNNPGFDDLLGEPFLEDLDSDQLGERVRPEVETQVRCKLRFTRYEEQNQDQSGNAPQTFATLTLFEEDLVSRGLLVGGKVAIRPNDRLLRVLKNTLGNPVRVDFEQDGRPGLHVFEVRPGETGTGVFTVLLERRNLTIR